MPSAPGVQMLSNGSNGNAAGRMDGTLSQSMDSVNTVAAEEEVSHQVLIHSILIDSVGIG